MSELATPWVSTNTPTTERPAQALRGQRVLACVLCQQRKVKCDRKFPCANCTKNHTQCLPATLAKRQRRRTFPERELLERLYKYEDLLRQNNIKFDPLDKSPSEDALFLKDDSVRDSSHDFTGDLGASQQSVHTSIKPDKVYNTRNMWRALNEGLHDGDDESDSSHNGVGEVAITNAWDQAFADNDHLLFGLPKSSTALSYLHPEAAQIFRLWHIYLQNVNPLLQVTHTPSLQGRIVEAASDLASIDPNLEALMFGIYLASVVSLGGDEVQAMFCSSKENLLSRFQAGCRTALVNCGFLRSDDRDSLTALYLYLVSIGINTVPRSLFSMLGVAVRIAERMGIHSEVWLAKHSILEAEMRRRLWWSLVLFDSRISELTSYRTTRLIPTWDCRIPANMNDSDLRTGMKQKLQNPPKVLGTLSDALFAVVRSEIADFIRHAKFYLEYTAPALRPIASDVQDNSGPANSELEALESMIEDKYLRLCDMENPLHFMTTWTTRAFFAKYRLIEYNLKNSSLLIRPTEVQLDTAIFYALQRLECDTKLMSSPLIKGFSWLLHFYFPFPAYIQIVQDLKIRPKSRYAERAWATMGGNYDARIRTSSTGNSPLFNIFARIILQAWEVREATFKYLEEIPPEPKFILSMKQALGQSSQDIQNFNSEFPCNTLEEGLNEFQMSIPIDLDSYMLDFEGYASHSDLELGR